ncbi:hypothetical protein BC938DRAFT_477533 [Jimgerdemannia flammicorona]|uniref:Uncharacterized protein n=1 Tax=Jimgerdemannia flammicorona TaxID=994334 RepID=A0A433P991_9FUNG|nr:hypothetical protein BC938DRAFT_477533 [Jimgerdemannia flammicorona]
MRRQLGVEIKEDSQMQNGTHVLAAPDYTAFLNREVQNESGQGQTAGGWSKDRGSIDRRGEFCMRKEIWFIYAPYSPCHAITSTNTRGHPSPPRTLLLLSHLSHFHSPPPRHSPHWVHSSPPPRAAWPPPRPAPPAPRPARPPRRPAYSPTPTIKQPRRQLRLVRPCGREAWEHTRHLYTQPSSS